MSRLLLFNLRTDADDAVLGFTTGWINALAEYFDHLDVLTMHAGRVAVAHNVRVLSVGREKGYSEARRLLNFYAILSRLLLQNRYDACFAHMMPLFAALGGPLLSARGVRTTLWYTHRQRTRQLELGLRFSHRAVTAVESSFPIRSAKVRALGHGIDTDVYSPQVYTPANRPRIVYVARLTPIKHQHVLLRALQHLPEAEVVLIGDVPDGFDESYHSQLRQMVQAMSIAERVTFAGAQTPQQILRWYASASAAVNLAPVGLFDKAPLESMAAGVPTIVSNPAFANVTGTHQALLHIGHPEDVAGLAERLRRLIALSHADRATIGQDLRAAVVAHHSLPRLIARLVNVLRSR